MSFIFRSLFVLSFLLFLGSGLFATIFSVFPSLLPFHHISLFSYTTMAPFQAFERENGEIVADGRSKSGAWTAIPLEPYLPLPQGERSAWLDLWSLAQLRSLPQDDPGRTLGYRRMAELLLQEQKKGNSLSTLRLSLETWPASLEGYSVLRHSPFLQRTLLVQVP